MAASATEKSPNFQNETPVSNDVATVKRTRAYRTEGANVIVPQPFEKIPRNAQTAEVRPIGIASPDVKVQPTMYGDPAFTGTVNDAVAAGMSVIRDHPLVAGGVVGSYIINRLRIFGLKVRHAPKLALTELLVVGGAVAAYVAAEYFGL